MSYGTHKVGSAAALLVVIAVGLAVAGKFAGAVIAGAFAVVAIASYASRIRRES
jgi:hypothetical protein